MFLPIGLTEGSKHQISLAGAESVPLTGLIFALVPASPAQLLDSSNGYTCSSTHLWPQATEPEVNQKTSISGKENNSFFPQYLDSNINGQKMASCIAEFHTAPLFPTLPSAAGRFQQNEGRHLASFWIFPATLQNKIFSNKTINIHELLKCVSHVHHWTQRNSAVPLEIVFHSFSNVQFALNLGKLDRTQQGNNTLGVFGSLLCFCGLFFFFTHTNDTQLYVAEFSSLSFT